MDSRKKEKEGKCAINKNFFSGWAPITKFYTFWAFFFSLPYFYSHYPLPLLNWSSCLLNSHVGLPYIFVCRPAAAVCCYSMNNTGYRDENRLPPVLPPLPSQNNTNNNNYYYYYYHYYHYH